MFWRKSWIRADASGYAGLRHATSSYYPTSGDEGTESESESGYISSSHIRLIRCLAVIGQASFTREHLV